MTSSCKKLFGSDIGGADNDDDGSDNSLNSWRWLEKTVIIDNDMLCMQAASTL